MKEPKHFIPCPKPTHNNFRDLTGKRFSRFLVVEHAGKSTTPSCRDHFWRCLCDCGEIVLIAAGPLVSGHAKSCGCRKLESGTAAANKANTTHGMRHAPEYYVWHSMLDRCRCLTSRNSKNYGGRGITVCDRWLDFSSFIADMGPRPSSKYSLERINNDGSYCKSNCRWATRKEQMRNKRTNRVLTYAGKTMCLAAWSDETGINQDALWMRLKLGWPVERALTEPIKIQA